MKILIVALIAFLLGFGAYWGYNNYQKLLGENANQKKTENSIPSSPDESNMPSSTPTPTPTPILGGTIEGILGYPGEGIPPLEVYAFQSTDMTKFFMVKTIDNQKDFSIKDVEPGKYYIVAYSTNFGNLAGAYSKAVSCGLSIECTDHSLIPIDVITGQTSTGAEVRDWYAPAGTFPQKPE